MKTNANSAYKEIDISELPFGSYVGTWEGYKVTANITSHLEVKFRVKDGIRGNVQCVVNISHAGVEVVTI